MDCLLGLKKIENETIDLVLTDCPYKICSGGTPTAEKWLSQQPKGMLNHQNNKIAKQGKIFNDNDILFTDWLPEIYRVLKPQSHCYIMVNSRNLKDLQIAAENVGFRFHNLLIWDKGNATPNRWYMQAFECILFFHKGESFTINNPGSTNILKIPNIRGTKVHPTEKPIELMEILLKNSSKEGEIVLDPFIGSGSTAIAAIKNNRKFIGFEINKDFFKISEERISQEMLSHKNSLF